MFSYTTCVEACIRVRCISFGFGVCPLYWEDQVFEYKYVVNLHWGWIWEISAFPFLFWNFYLNNASSVGQTRCNCSDHLFIRGVFSTQPMFQSMEPTGACQVYILLRHQATSIFDKKIWRKKPGLWHFLGSYILYHQSFATWRNWKTWAFSWINLTTNMLRVCKNYLSSGICHHF